MATAAKLVTMRRPEGLTPELREFLDRVVVPALVRKYLEGVTPTEKTLAPASGPAAYSPSSTLSAKRQGRKF